MRKSIFLAFLLTVMLVLACISCKSTSPSTPAEVPTFDGQNQELPEASPKVSTESLRESLMRAEEARKRAIDFESPSYFPSDWEAVESQYTEAANIQNMQNMTENEVRQATASLNAVAGAYDELFNKTIPLYAQAREDEVMAARDELISTGLTDSYPEYLQNADKIALSALDQYEAKDYYTARDTAAAALNEYETLLIAAKVYLKRQEIIDRGFYEYDPENFDKADEIALEALDKYNDGDKQAAADKADEAMLRYNLLLTNGWIAYADDRRNSASSEREQALSNKVNIAVRDTFREADTIYNQAVESLRAEKFEEAASLFTDAEARFTLAGHETDEKRARALETIRIAEERIEESSGTATEAERIIEGGSR